MLKKEEWAVLALLLFALALVALNPLLPLQAAGSFTAFSSLETTPPTSLETISQRLAVVEKTTPLKARTVDDLTVGERQVLLVEILPHGVPASYGTELRISFDKPEPMIATLSKLDGEWVNGKSGIRFEDLNKSAQQRYLKIGSQIACEFCCGARTLVSKDGTAACQCAHSAAMRGLAKYLLQKHAAEFSDKQILEELTKIKTISFPKQMVRRAFELEANGKPINAITQNLPSQVGGC